MTEKRYDVSGPLKVVKWQNLRPRLNGLFDFRE